MKLIDNDLLSMQEARILAENSKEAQRLLSTFSQEKLDGIIEGLASELLKNLDKISEELQEEVDFGNQEDKKKKIKFILEKVVEKIKPMKCVGVIGENKEEKIVDIGVPMGVIVVLSSESNPISTMIYNLLIGLKTGNTMIFNLQNNSKNTMIKTLDFIIDRMEELGAPRGTVSYLSRISKNGIKELINHENIDLILNTGVEELLEEIKLSGKPMVYGRTGNTPAFIEESADIKKSVGDIIRSKTFDNGVMSGSEQAIVVSRAIVEKVTGEFQKQGGYFLSEDESYRLKEILFDKQGKFKRNYIGRSAKFIGNVAGIEVPSETKLLISREKYISLDNPFSKEKLCPLVSFYVEDNWREACEKCIELLLNERQGHTLVIHSKDEEIIREFALKKPVGRILVNTSGAQGSMGESTNLFPSMTLGCGVIGKGMTSDNVSPQNLIYIRKVAYEKNIVEEKKDSEFLNKLEKILREILK